MTLKLFSGFDFGNIGSFSLVFNNGSDKTASITSGTYCHVDLQTVTGAGFYDDIAGRIKTAMDAVAGGGETFTVSFSTTTLLFTITRSTGTAWTITATTNTLAQRILGLNSLPLASNGSGVLTTQVAPWYIMTGAMGAVSNPTGDYEPSEIAQDAEADDGTAFGIARDEAPIWSDFNIQFEPKAAVYQRHAAAASSWTWQQFFKHVRNTEPYLIIDDVESTVHLNRAGGASWKPLFASKNLAKDYHFKFDTRVLGRL